ncbi:MAG: integrase core domain-containing protein [Thermoanaerobaculia bacterium]
MPWQEKKAERLRMEFIVAHQSEQYSFTELCELFGISREAGYYCVRRFRENGIEGLKEQSRAPKSCPHRVEPAVEQLLIEARHKHPTWGPKKLLPWLARRHDVDLPSRSTASEILKRAGLCDVRRRRRRLEHPGKPTTDPSTANALWAADFKGEFLMRDGNYCYPLTVTDQHSRYILACKALRSTKEIPVQLAFERLFREYGLPEAIRTDNGVPFATIALGRLSRLSVWWIKLGIRPELTQPSHPEQNGQHERMHKTLKAETTRPPGAHLQSQQRKFDRWRREFNEERPHESLGQEPPATLYTPSLRELPKKIENPTYPGHFQVRYVSRNNGIRWNRRWINVSATLREEYVGCEEVDDGVWNVWFGPLLLGRFDEHELRICGVRGLQ